VTDAGHITAEDQPQTSLPGILILRLSIPMSGVRTQRVTTKLQEATGIGLTEK